MIRELTKEDYPSIMELGLLINPLFSTEKINENDKIIVMEENNRIIGFLQYYKLYETIDLLNIAVLPEYRRQGIATRLIEYLTTINGIEKIMLEVKATNKQAIKLYEKMGFKTLRVIKNYYENIDALSMERVIE